MEDYTERGSALEEYNFFTFLVDTYEVAIPSSGKGKGKAVEELLEEEESDCEDHQHPSKRGRKPNLRSPYQPSHPRHATRQRMLRTNGHKYLPSFVGPYFPRNDDDDRRELYCCSILALLKPWRSLSDLRTPGETWDTAFTTFVTQAPKATRDIISSIQYYYHCSDSAQQSDQPTATREKERRTGLDPLRESEAGASDLVDLGEDVEPVIPLTEEGFRELQALGTAPTRETNHGKVAVEIGRTCGLFSERGGSDNWVVTDDANAPSIGPATGDDLAHLEQWRHLMAQNVAEQHSHAVQIDQTPSTPVDAATSRPAGGGDKAGQGSITRLEDERTSTSVSNPSTSTANSTPESPLELEDFGRSELLEDQKRAFDIVSWHLEETLAGRDVPQLLMQMHGEGGTGKSKVIRTITRAFEERGMGDMLTRSAFTGIAASIIDGRTLHTVGSIPVRGGMPSQAAIQELTKTAGRRRYLIIDEISMIGREFLSKLSTIFQMISDALGLAGKGSLPFGGLHVIIVGDLHQFPPVVSRRQAPLYWPCHPNDTDEENAGRMLYEKFTIVVILREQVRVVDKEWLDFLRHARIGACKPHHIDMLRSLILTDKRCPKTDFSSGPWSKALLVTPRHAVRMLWNDEALRKHCQSAKEPLFICEAQDRIGNRTLTWEEKFAALQKNGPGGKGRKESGGLPKTVEFARGMEVMVTYNVATDLDVANGARGRVHDIVLGANEPAVAKGESVVKLESMPSYLLIKLDRTKAEQLPGLPAGVLPLEPITKSFTIKVKEPSGTIKSKTVKRTQLPLTAAYAFTDYRSQGQTISHVVVDIGQPPSGGLTPFHAYVALSRSSGRETIRLLRDFDETLFTKVPCEKLEAEDRRLEDLDKETKEWWDRMRKSS